MALKIYFARITNNVVFKISCYKTKWKIEIQKKVISFIALN